MLDLYVTSLIKTDSDLLNSKLSLDTKILLDGAVYYPNFVCKISDMTLFNQILKEIETNSNLELVKWSQHFKIENPTISQTFNKLINVVAEKLKVEVVQTRLNYYKNHLDWKPYHHDSHVYDTNKKIREDYTFGISLGATRELSFKHEQSGNVLTFPQNNGDIFAFDGNVNKAFLHGVPKIAYQIGARISLIAWGRKL